MKKTILLFSILLASCAGKQTQEIRTMERLSTASRNDYYVSNRAPLQPLQFIKRLAAKREQCLAEERWRMGMGRSALLAAWLW